MSPEQLLLITAIVCLSYGIESIFGLGGTILTLTLLGLFFDIKEMIVLTIFTGFISSLIIFFSHRELFNWKIFKRVVLILIPGIFLGTFVLKYSSSDIILKLFGIFLVTYSGWTLFGKSFEIKEKWKNFTNFLNGIIGGIFGTTGPLLVIAFRDVFANKSEMRITLAAIFMFVHVARVPTYYANDLLKIEEVFQYWWLFIPMIFTIWVGHHIHLKISDKIFQSGVSVLLGLAGITFLF